MPNLTAGSRIKAADTPPTVSDSVVPQFTCTNTSFSPNATSSGTTQVCGVSFIAPTTGRVIIYYDADITNNNASGSTTVAPAVRNGSSVGGGTVVVAASADEAITSVGTIRLRAGCHTVVEGLTPGLAYNAVLEHRVGANTGTVRRRRITVAPLT